MKALIGSPKWLWFSPAVGLFTLFLLFSIARSNNFLASLSHIFVKRSPASKITLLTGQPSTDLAPSPRRSCDTQPDVLMQLVEMQRRMGDRRYQASFRESTQYLSVRTLAYADAIAFPAIHPRAQLATVPVLMYHDILPQQEVFFDVTPTRLREDFERIRDSQMTPISLDQLVAHLQTGLPLPEKPVLLTFDDGYAGHYQYVYPLLKEFSYPAVFSIYTGKPDGLVAGRSTVTWEQLQTMAADPLVTIAAHTVTHPANLTLLPRDKARQEITNSKRILEERLGMPIRYFTYPEGYYNAEVAEIVQEAGYEAALTMDKDSDGRFAGQSESLLAIARFGESSVDTVIEQAWGGPPSHILGAGIDFTGAIERSDHVVDDVSLTLVSGGRPTTIHADSRYQVAEILQDTPAIAGVDGAFFSMKHLDSNLMIGPVLSQSTGQFVPGERGVNPFLIGRPLVLISPATARFVPFDPARHNTLAGIQAELPGVTDAFVGAAQVVKAGQPQPASALGQVPNADIPRHRAFWGIDAAGKPVVGISERVDAVRLGEILVKVGLWDAVMLDSGASTSLVYRGESLVGFEPRPVPHVVALMPPTPGVMCAIALKQAK